MSRDAFGLGRAYEWVGRDEYGKEKIAKFDAEQTFVIYDNTKYINSICGVHYFVETFLDKSLLGSSYTQTVDTTITSQLKMMIWKMPYCDGRWRSSKLF